MRYRLALLTGSIAASATLTVALAAAGFAPAQPGIDPAAAAEPPAPTARVQVDTVYLPAPVAPPTITVHRTLRSTGEHEDHERGGAD